MNDDDFRALVGSQSGGESGPNRAAQKRNATLLGVGSAFAGAFAMGKDIHVNQDPAVLGIGVVIILICLFAGK